MVKYRTLMRSAVILTAAAVGFYSGNKYLGSRSTPTQVERVQGSNGLDYKVTLANGRSYDLLRGEQGELANSSDLCNQELRALDQEHRQRRADITTQFQDLKRKLRE